MSITYINRTAVPDTLDLSDAVIGEDLLLSAPESGELVLHRVQGGRAERMGVYADAASAWRAIDSIDEEYELAVAA
ncbi:MAG TPA: hypothetical protein VHX88_16460 [Solirubrobacteraceae bacterium]|jgi:hypothetical protein|nr:hypothetical protein [Solirubrobacteraceae bacterium]